MNSKKEIKIKCLLQHILEADKFAVIDTTFTFLVVGLDPDELHNITV